MKNNIYMKIIIDIEYDYKIYDTIQKRRGMNEDDLKYTYQYLHRFGNKLVVEIRKRTPVEYGDLKAAIDYKVINKRNQFGIEITHDGAEYGMYLDDADETGKYHYRSGRFKGQETTGFISYTIDDLEDEFINGLENAYTKDLERYIKKQLEK